MTRARRALFAILLALARAATAGDAAPSPRTYSGRRVIDVIRTLELAGRLRVIYSSELVPKDLVVATEPRSEAPAAVLAEIVAPHGLELRPGPGGSLLVVRATRAHDAPPAQRRVTTEIEVAPSRFSLLRDDPEAPWLLTREGIERTPHVADDPYRILTRMPGTAAGDVSTAFHLRGGVENETLVLLDGQEIRQPYHLRAFQNLLTVFDAKAIGGVELSTGGFSAEHGNKMSGVLDIVSLTPREKPHGSISLSFLSADVLTDGSLAGGAGRWLLSARRGYLDLALDPDSTGIRPSYYDGFAKLDASLGSATTLSAQALLAADDVTFHSDDAEESSTSRSRSATVWWSGTTLLSPTLLAGGSLSWERDTSTRDGIGTGDSMVALDDARSFRSWGLKQDSMLELDGTHTLKWGGEARFQDARYDHESSAVVTDPALLALGGKPLTIRSAHLSLRGDSYGIYAADRARLLPGLTAELGIRWDGQTFLGGSPVSPRLNVAWAASERTVVRAAWGLFSQAQGLHELKVEDGENAFQGVQRAEHRILSLERAFDAGFRVRVEAYQKLVRDPSPRYENLIDPFNVLHEFQIDRVRVAPQSSESRGVEVTLRRDGRKLSFSLGYDLSYAEDVVDGSRVARAWDQRHAVQATLSWRPTELWNASAAWRYHTGWPTTAIVLTRSASDPDVYGLSYGPRNGERFPDFHQLDLRVSRAFRFKWGSLDAYVDVFNVYNRKNANSIDEVRFEARPGGRIETLYTYGSGFEFFPSFGLRLSF